MSKRLIQGHVRDCRSVGHVRVHEGARVLSATSADGRGRVWRPPLVLQTLFVSSGVALCISAFLPWDGASTGEGGGLFRLLLFVGGLAWFVPAYRSRMELRDDRLILRYAFRSRVASLDTLVALTAGRQGLWFQTVDGAQFGSPGLIGEKSSLASWLGRRTRADDMVDAILAARPGP